MRAITKIIFAAMLLISLIFLVSALGNDTGKVDSEVLKQINQQEKVNVIVSLDEGKTDDKRLLGFMHENIVEQVKNKENSVEFSSGGFKAEVTKNELNSLVKDEKVEHIELEKTFSILLQDSAGIINTSKTWNLQFNGVNLTGISQTICIIDTGANYSHPDLIGRNLTSCNLDCINKACIENCSETDLNGHGTHVAGIAAASGGINGIGKGASFIALKVFPNSGQTGATTTGIKNAIDWCVDNSSIFNISVITMSLGTDTLYNSYCDSDSVSLNTSITNAFNKNISVTVATGNDNSLTGISLPACMPKAIPVSATDKSDNIASYSNRNSLVKLFAPGSNINSTWLSGYAISSGTSMATPHAAGAIAIINQFLNLTGVRKTPKEIEAVLNNTGRRIQDTSGLNYSRINIYSAMEMLSFNSAVLSSPMNNIFTRQNQTFVCNSSSNVAFSNATFYVYNSSSLIYNQTKNISGLTNSSIFYYNFTREDGYTWNCDFVNNMSFVKNTGNYAVTYDLTSPSIIILSPINNSWQNSGKFNLTLNENGSCWYSLNSGAGNFSMSSIDLRNFNATNSTLVKDSSYNVSYYCNDSAGNTNSSISAFRIDVISPNVTIISPEEGYSATGTTSVSFQYNATDNINLSRCDLMLNNVIVASNSSSINNTNTISYSVSSGSYSWQINCTDVAGNIGNSSTRTLTISSPPIQTSSGGGGGGGAPLNRVYTPSPAQISGGGGYSQELKKDDSIKLVFDSSGVTETHSVVIKNVGASSADIEVSSEKQTATLKIGEEKKFNLNSDNLYDLLVRLNSIANSKANLTVKEIHEEIVRPKLSPPMNETKIAGNEKNKIETGNVELARKMYIGLYISLVFVVLIAGYFVFRRFKEHLKVKADLRWGK